jgi:hydroxymethylbilane synthase
VRELIAGTRGSALAQGQARWVTDRLQVLCPGLVVRTEIIRTTGDALPDQPLSQIGAKGAFSRELGDALLAGRVDLAVHSLKDLPTDPTPGLTIAAVTEREDARDVLVSRQNLGLDELPAGSRIGTSSPRRMAQLLARRPDLRVVSIRGNVETRLSKALGAEYDAVVLAAAGLRRLNLAGSVTQYLTVDVMLPAPGQGALAIETRSDDADTLAVIAGLQHQPTRLATNAERSFLRALGGGCQMPVAAYAEVRGAELTLRGLIASAGGTGLRRGELAGAADLGQEIGWELARRLMEGRSVVILSS